MSCPCWYCLSRVLSTQLRENFVSKRQAVTAVAYDKSGRVISIGRNSYINTHPLQAKYANKSGNPDAIYIHSELDAIIRSRGSPLHSLFVSLYIIFFTFSFA